MSGETLYKEVTKEGEKLKIFFIGDEELFHEVPEWNEETGEEELAFKIGEDTYFLSEFMAVRGKATGDGEQHWLDEFDGVLSTTYFSGILIKMVNGEGVKIFRY